MKESSPGLFPPGNAELQLGNGAEGSTVFCFRHYACYTVIIE